MGRSGSSGQFGIDLVALAGGLLATLGQLFHAAAHVVEALLRLGLFGRALAAGVGQDGRDGEHEEAGEKRQQGQVTSGGIGHAVDYRRAP